MIRKAIMIEIFSNISYYLRPCYETIRHPAQLKEISSRLWEKTLAADKQKLATSVVCAAGSILFITYYRPDQIAWSAASYLVQPVLYTAGAAVLIVCNAKGAGANTQEAFEEPIRKFVRCYATGEDLVQGCFKKWQPAEGSEANASRGSVLFQKAKNFVASLPGETKNTLTGAYQLFVDCGGEPAALVLGTSAGEALLIATDGDTFGEVILITSLAATAAAAHVIYHATPQAAPLVNGAQAESQAIPPGNEAQEAQPPLVNLVSEAG